MGDINHIKEKYGVYTIIEKLNKRAKDGHSLYIGQCECVAPNVQKNKYRVDEPDLYVFNVIFPNGRMNSIKAKALMSDKGLKFVPIINESVSLKGMTVNEVLTYATGKSELYDTLREGIVFRSLDGKQSFKAVSPEFLIKNEE